MHILIIPGWQETPQTWDPVARILKAVGYNVTVLDYQMPKNEDVEDQANQAEYYLTEKTIVVGSSIGSRIAVQLISRKHHHIVGAMLLSAPCLPYTGTPGRIFNFIKKLALLPLILIPKFIKRRVGKLLQALFRISDEKLQYRRVISQDQTSLLQIIKTPIKLVWGANDQVVSPSIGKKMDMILTHSDFLEVAQGDSQLHVSQSKLLANLIDHFARTR